MSHVLLIDFGSTYTKLTAVDVEKEEILGTARGITTVETDIMEGLQEGLDVLFAQTGKLEFQRVLGCSSAAGGLKMVAIGLVPELTAEAAKRAALGAGAKVLGVYCNELSEYEIEEIAALKPEIILLAGGTDGGNKEVILHNARMLCTLGMDVPVLVAGNKSVTPQVVGILSKVMTEVVHTENVMPRLGELNIDPARGAIRDLFLRRIIEAKGLNKANKFIDKMMMPTPAAVLKAAELLGTGTPHESGWGDLMIVDIGGATTDLYSIAKGEPKQPTVTMRGLPEPFAKRTVEGDLGMRYSATALLKAASAPVLAQKAGVSEEEVAAYCHLVENQVDTLPQTPREQAIEDALGWACTKVAAQRHVGKIESVFSCVGEVFVQVGKDLTTVEKVIGTGGVIVHHERPECILEGIRYDTATAEYLKPKQCDYYIDGEYILSAMGLLSEEQPEVALRMMKKYLKRRQSAWN